jgi:hypothetical protein
MLQVLFSVNRLAQSIVFKKLFESNRTLFPKENLFLMTWFTSVKIYKKYRGHKVFVSRVQTELINSVYRPWENFRIQLNVYPSLKFNIFFYLRSSV